MDCWGQAKIAAISAGFSSSIQNLPEKGCKTPCHASRSLRPAIAKA